jgi:hypothetical protein
VGDHFLPVLDARRIDTGLHQSEVLCLVVGHDKEIALMVCSKILNILFARREDLQLPFRFIGRQKAHFGCAGPMVIGEDIFIVA